MISLDKYGIRLDALTAGTVDGVEVSAAAALSSGARVVCTLTAALPPDAVHLLAASGEMTPEAPTAQFSLYTEPMRRYFLGRRVTETLPARLEFFDLAHQTVLAACTVQVQNSRLLWGDAAAGVPEAQIGLTRADMAQLEREMAEAKAAVSDALAAGEETKKYAMAAASAAESARQSAAGSKRVANAAQEAATAAQGTAAAAQEAVNTHAARTDNPHGVTAKQVGADAAGTAQLLIDTHDRDPAAHPDIHQSIGNMDSVCRDYITAHNTSESAHSDIRSAAQTVAEELSAHTTNTNNPHGVTAAQVGALPLSGGTLSGALTVPSLILTDPSGGKWRLSVTASGELLLSAHA